MLRIFRDSKLLEKWLETLKLEGGFDSVRLLGGTSKDGKHSAFIFAWYYDHFLREKFLLVIPYKTDYFQTEIILLTEEKETYLQTAAREAREESGIRFLQKNLNLFHKIIVDSNIAKGEEHIKCFFSYTKYLNLSQITKNFLEGSGEVGSPFLIKKSLVKKYLYKGHYNALAS